MPNKRPRKILSLSKKSLGAGLIFLSAFALGYALSESERSFFFPSSSSPSQIGVCFSPEGQCETPLLQALDSAKKQILVQCYTFTSKPIADALLQAFERGVEVKILCDASQRDIRYSQIPRLQQAGIDVKTDQTKGLAHNKIIIIDQRLVFSGSYNFTKAAHARNAENLLMIQNPKIVKAYLNNWNKRAASLI